MSPAYVGVDLADDKAKRSRVDLLDIDGTLSIRTVQRELGPPLVSDEMAAIDSPFAYPQAFVRLLVSLDATVGDERQFKNRQTEIAIRRRVSRLRFIAEANSLAPRFFAPQGHVQSTLGLEIVPRAIREVLRFLRVDGGTAAEKQAAIRAARLGKAPILECLPRLFLYSVLERVWSACARPLPSLVLEAARDYKPRDKERPASKSIRRAYRELLVQYIVSTGPLWMGTAQRRFDLDSSLVSGVDHDFDAFLAALTAFMHDHGETWSWAEMPEFDEDVIEQEGHMFILRPVGGEVGT